MIQRYKFTKAICSGGLHFTFNPSGLAISSASDRALESATLSWILLKRKSIERDR
jgi:hypothetical protein